MVICGSIVSGGKQDKIAYTILYLERYNFSRRCDNQNIRYCWNRVKTTQNKNKRHQFNNNNNNNNNKARK